MTAILDPLALLTISLAAYYWAYVTIATSGPYALFARLRARAGVQETRWDAGAGEWTACKAPGLNYLLCCPWCAMPYWIVAWGAVWLIGGAVVVQVFAAAGLACLVYAVASRQ